MSNEERKSTDVRAPKWVSAKFYCSTKRYEYGRWDASQNHLKWTVLQYTVEAVLDWENLHTKLNYQYLYSDYWVQEPCMHNVECSIMHHAHSPICSYADLSHDSQYEVRVQVLVPGTSTMVLLEKTTHASTSFLYETDFS